MQAQYHVDGAEEVEGLDDPGEVAPGEFFLAEENLSDRLLRQQGGFLLGVATDDDFDGRLSVRAVSIICRTSKTSEAATTSKLARAMCA